jgi:putative nucleotidyltransferase with HDIG domain
MADVLFVDDEPHILRAIERALADEEESTLLTFTDPREALMHLERNAAAVVVTDQKMPAMAGTDFLEQVKVRWPEAVCLIMSGYADLEVLTEAINRTHVFRFINKPFANAELVLAVREALDHYRLQAENQRLSRLTRQQNEELVRINRQLEGHVSEKTEQLKRNEEQLQEMVKRLKQALDGSVSAMAMAVETRDPYTAGHQKRVADLACSLAEEMGLPAHVVEGIRMAGIVHDLGKIYVPAEILNRPGKLTTIERELIHTHPQVGFDILKGIEFPWPIARIVLQHHERIDGSGYPQGLPESEILLEAKIIAVADVMEAMSSHRPYRPAPGPELALAEIEKNMGRKYDREAAAACLHLFRAKGFSMTTWNG